MTDINHSLSVDCVVFGFDGESLKVLLVDRKYPKNGVMVSDSKLPGRMIFDNEDLDTSAAKVLKEMTGLDNIYLRQFRVFSDPARIEGEDLAWVNTYHDINTNRVVTVGYYALVKLSDKILAHTKRNNAYWSDVQTIRQLALDHKRILAEALFTLNKELVQSPIAFELLPRKFTIRQLRNLYSVILGIEIDNRNFRKKILASGYIKGVDEKEANVAHKPAQYYTFNVSAYRKAAKDKMKFNFINWRS